jgi:hypothetical protein
MMKQQLTNLSNRHEKIIGDMRAKHASEYKNKEDEFTKELMELEWEQDVEIKDAIKADEDQLSEALQVQERELAMVCYLVTCLYLFRKATSEEQSQKLCKSDEFSTLY